MSDMSTFCKESLYENKKIENHKKCMISGMRAFIENPCTRVQMLEKQIFPLGHFYRESLYENKNLNENDALT